MHVISRKKLVEFSLVHSDAQGPLEIWYHMLDKSNFPTPDSIKQKFRTVDFIPGDRLVFNIKGNTYRIVVKVNYGTGTVFIRFVGKHAEYSRIDAETI
jgi:mRNA interferase HigB